MTDRIDVKPFDRSEIEPCLICRKGLMHDGNLTFYEVTVTQCVADLTSIRQQHGLEVMLGGAAAVAAAFSPTTNVAHRLPPTRRLVCLDCAMTPTTLALIVEAA